MKKKKRKQKFKGFDLISDTSGKITDGVYLKEDKSEVIICFTQNKYLYFRPLEEKETSL